MVDRGRGDDVYLVSAGEAQKGGDDGYIPMRTLAGQAHASMGSALLADDGGADSFTVTSAARWHPGSEPPPINGVPGYFLTSPMSMAYVQGAALGGTALILEGSGRTRYELIQDTSGVARSISAGQGYGLLGTGQISDEGGDDSYRIESVATYETEVTVDDSCVDAAGEPCGRAAARMDQRLGMINVAWGQGMGVGNLTQPGVGMIDDRAGDDAYAAAGRYHLSVDLTDRLGRPEAPPDLEVLSASSQPDLLVQGTGQFGGSGVLVDRAGTDSYVAEYVKETVGRATSERASGKPSVRAASLLRLGVAAQGATWLHASAGALVDLGGTGDTFRATAELPARAEPGGESYSFGAYWPFFHGAGTGSGNGAVLAALGESSKITSSPSRPLCDDPVGARGFGTWVECSVTAAGLEPEPVDPGPGDLAGGGAGHAPGSSGAPTALSFVEGTTKGASPGSQVVVAELRLTGASGAPIEGQRVQVNLQYRLPPLVAGAVRSMWSNAWETDAITDEHGIARVPVPLLLSGMGVQMQTDWDYRLFATYDGRPAAQLPSHATAPLPLT